MPNAKYGAKYGVLLANLGTPTAPTAPAVKKFLAEFLMDPRVVELPRWLWWPILHGPILWFRPKRVAKKYASVWMGEQSPLQHYSLLQTSALQERVPHYVVSYASRYGNPSLPERLDALCEAGCTHVTVLPLYPQYSSSTNGSVGGVVSQWMQKRRTQPSLAWVRDYHDHPAYIEALALQLQAHWQLHPPSERLVLSFHGLPRVSLEQQDPYYFQCHRTADLLRRHLALPSGKVIVSFQSRFGAQTWLQPYTQDTVVALAKESIASIDVYCPGFSVDCLETLEEINIEIREAFHHHGGKVFHYIPCLNATPAAITLLHRLVEDHAPAMNRPTNRPLSPLA